MAGTDDQLIQMLLQNLSGSQPDKSRPLLPSSFSEGMSNLGHGLARYGEETLNRNMGIPYQDPIQNALARSRLAEEIQQLQQKGIARKNFPDQTQIYNPKVTREYFNLGTFNPETDEQDLMPFESKSYSPEQVHAARTLSGVTLEDTSPAQRAAAQSSAEGRRIWNQQTKDRAAKAKEDTRLGEERLAEKKAENLRDQELRKYSLSLRREASVNKVAEHALQNGYESQDIAKAIRGAIDPETNALDTAKLYDLLKPGESPKFKLNLRKHEDDVRLQEERLKVARVNARRLAMNRDDAEGYRRFNAAVDEWDRQFRIASEAYKSNMAGWGKPFSFSVSPPTPEDYIGLTFKRGGGSPGENRPAPPSKPGGMMDFIKPNYGAQAEGFDWVTERIYGKKGK